MLYKEGGLERWLHPWLGVFDALPKDELGHLHSWWAAHNRLSLQF